MRACTVQHLGEVSACTVQHLGEVSACMHALYNTLVRSLHACTLRAYCVSACDAGPPPLQYPDSTPPAVTFALYLPSFGRLVCGQADGSIAVLSALQAASVLMLKPRKFSRG